MRGGVGFKNLFMGLGEVLKPGARWPGGCDSSWYPLMFLGMKTPGIIPSNYCYMVSRFHC